KRWPQMPARRTAFRGLALNRHPVGLAGGGTGHQTERERGERESLLFHGTSLDSCFEEDDARPVLAPSTGNAPYGFRCGAKLLWGIYGSNPSGASSKCAKSNPGATVQPTRV